MEKYNSSLPERAGKKKAAPRDIVVEQTYKSNGCVQRIGCCAFVHRHGILKKELRVDVPNGKLVTDISCIHTKPGVLYLSIIRSLCDSSIAAPLKSVFLPTQLPFCAARTIWGGSYFHCHFKRFPDIF